MKTALFAGTFDPPTLGHQEIIRRADLLCSKLYVAVAKSQGKHPFLLPHQERIFLMKELTKSMVHVEVISFNGLAVDCAREHRVDFLVRGLRNGGDLEYEMQMGWANYRMIGIETVCLISSPEHSQINSTFIREIAAHGRRLDCFVPSEIEPRVFELLREQDKQDRKRQD